VETSSAGYLVVGGEFTNVNGIAQSGLAVFRQAKLATSTVKTELISKPLVVSLSSGTTRIGWRATYDRESSSLTYQVLRDDSATPIATITKTSRWYDLPEMSFTDTSVAPGTTHTYKIRRSTVTPNSRISPASTAITVASSGPLGAYTSLVSNDGADKLIRFDEAAGSTTVTDTLGRGSVTVGSITLGTSGAITSSAARTAATFSGTSSSYATISTTTTRRAPSRSEVWFKDHHDQGRQDHRLRPDGLGNSGRYDRQIYLKHAGKGVTSGCTTTAVHAINTSASFNDGQWHHVVGTRAQTYGALRGRKR